MFYTTPHPVGRLAAAAQIEHEAWIARSFAAESGWRHAGTAEESFDATQDWHDGQDPFQRDKRDSV